MSKLFSAYVGTLGTTSGAGGMLTLKNPEGVDIYVTRLILDITTKSTGICSVDAGIASTIASSDNLIDGLDVATATGAYENLKNPGTNGKQGQRWGKTGYLTVTQATGSAAGLVGKVYIEYIRLG